MMMADSAATVATKPQARSRVSNGSALLAGVDGRSTWARRLRDLIELHVADLGGDDNISEAERAIVRRAAVLITELERMECSFALSEGAPDIATLDAYQRAAGNLRRLLESVGLERRARDVTPTLRTYLATSAAPVTRQIDAAATHPAADADNAPASPARAPEGYPA
jgi:hypothetical protein